VGEPHSRRLLQWQILTACVLVVGYSGYYLCRSNFSVTLPMITDDLAAHGMDYNQAKIRLGTIASLGIFGYAVGKFVSGALGDLLGGRRNFLLGMAGSVLCTLAFALGGALPVFTLAWLGNRLVQSLGWVGMVKIASRWFSFSAYGTVMGVISLSFLFGDAVARRFMQVLIEHGASWQGVFYAAAGVLFGILVLSALLLRETPRAIGEPEPEANPTNLYATRAEKRDRPAIAELVAPLLKSRVFWYVCVLSFGLTLMRETFNTWTPTYFREVVGLTDAEAAGDSAIFPFLGGISVLLAGFLSDWLGRGGRAVIILVGLALAGAMLLALAHSEPQGSRWISVSLVGIVAFLMIGPYSYLAGAIALDFGGKEGSATASGIIDGVGYLGGVLAGDSMARISVSFGWQSAFTALAGVSWLSCVAAILFWVDQRRPIAPRHQPDA
jgi:OPA family glycerol-3-phosphate transporter-like MFS transporter